MSRTEGRIRNIVLWSVLCILICPLSMIILGIRYRNQCSGQSQLPTYHIIFASIWILNLIRYIRSLRYLDIIFVIVWLFLLLLILPGYIYIFNLRNIIKISL